MLAVARLVTDRQMLLNPILSLLVVVSVQVSRQLYKRSSSQESDFVKPGTTTIESISNAGHSVINHKSMCTCPERAIILCHADSCLPSPPEVKQCIFRWYISCPSAVRIVGVFYQGLSIFHLTHTQRDECCDVEMSCDVLR